MQDKLYIPKTLRVGFQGRSDTYTKKLAYIIYYDDKGVLRKEKSWNGWCTKPGTQTSSWNGNKHVTGVAGKDFNPVDVDNVPHAGFHLNKGVQRNGYYGGGRSMCRVYDDRGFEFEITIDNLMFILMGSDCLRRGLEGEYVYAWSGNNLVLLPTNCEEYTNSTKFTALQGKKIGVEDLEIGCSYKTKQQEDLIYLGKYNWRQSDYNSRVAILSGHVFSTTKGEHHYHGNNYSTCNFRLLNALDTLAVKNSDTPVSNIAELIDNYLTGHHSAKVNKYEVKDRGAVHLASPNKYSLSRSKTEEQKVHAATTFKEIESGKFIAYHITGIYKVKPGVSINYYSTVQDFNLEGYKMVAYKSIDLTSGELIVKSCTRKDVKLYTKEEIKAMEFKEVIVYIGEKDKYTTLVV